MRAWLALRGGPKVPEDDSPDGPARRRLERDTLERAGRASAQAPEQKTRAHGRFHGKDVVGGAGTPSTLPDTPANQRAYPPSARQNPGGGFPLLRWGALFSLNTGALLAVAPGPKPKAELQLFRKLWDQLPAGTLFLADRGFCDFVTMSGLWRRQVDSL